MRLDSIEMHRQYNINDGTIFEWISDALNRSKSYEKSNSGQAKPEENLKSDGKQISRC